MTHRGLDRLSVGWIGAGRMGVPMAARLLKAGCRVAVYNRTKAKAKPLADAGAEIVDSAAELAERDLVFTMVAGPAELLEVTLGGRGLLSRQGRAPALLVDCSTVSIEASAEVRRSAAGRGTAMLAAPVSGNGKVVKAGKLSIVASGPRQAYDDALPYLSALAPGVSYVGEGELARTVKLCHNVFLAAVIQSLVEVTVLAEKSGVSRSAFLDFMNKSVLGSTFSRYKTPALVKLDYTPTFTPPLLRKDLDLALAAARAIDVPMPLAALTREIVQTLIGHGYADCDFAALLTLQAKAANMTLEPELVDVGDGLSPAESHR